MAKSAEFSVMTLWRVVNPLAGRSCVRSSLIDEEIIKLAPGLNGMVRVIAILYSV